MSKTLIVCSHSDIAQSTVNQCWLQALGNFPERFTIHHLDSVYPDGIINVAHEQALVDAHKHLVLQFPVYWFNCPPLLKKWLDEVFLYGWAYGSTGTRLRGKKIGLAVSTGINAEGYSTEGSQHCAINEVLRPFELTMNYVAADYQPVFVFYGIDSHAGYDAAALQQVEQGAADYLAHLARHFS